MEGNTNRKDGLRFESELCQKLAEAGWWAHDMTQNAAGQPADVIAVRANHAVLIDCKICSRDSFDMKRIEPNQESAMTLWEEMGNEYAFYALKLSNGLIYMMDWKEVKFLKQQNVKNIPLWYMAKQFATFEQWLDIMEDEI